MSQTRSYTVELNEADGQLLEKLAAEHGFDETIVPGGDTFGTFTFPAFIRMMVRIGIYGFEHDHEAQMRHCEEKAATMDLTRPEWRPSDHIDDDIPF